MSKKAMSLMTLIMTVTSMVLAAGVMSICTTSMSVNSVLVEDIEVESMQQLANMAYSSIYFSNLTKGIRRELTVKEIRSHMIKNGTSEQELANYNIKIKDGDVFVTKKGN